MRKAKLGELYKPSRRSAVLASLVRAGTSGTGIGARPIGVVVMRKDAPCGALCPRGRRRRPDVGWSRPPAFEGGGGGLVSTADDYLAFATALLAGGTHHGERCSHGRR